MLRMTTHCPSYLAILRLARHEGPLTRFFPGCSPVFDSMYRLTTRPRGSTVFVNIHAAYHGFCYAFWERQFAFLF